MIAIGLGNVGSIFARATGFKTILVDHIKRDGETFVWSKQLEPEEYEGSLPLKLERKLKKNKQPVVFFVSPEDELSLGSLVVLEKIKNNPIYVVYLVPTKDRLEDYRIHQRRNVTQGVLCEYARSGLFMSLFMVDLQNLTTIAADNTREASANIVSWYLNSFFELSARRADYGEAKQQLQAALIATIGVLNIGSLEERNFCDLPVPQEKCFYYLVPKGDDSIVQLRVVKYFERESKKYQKTSYGVFYIENLKEELVYSIIRTSEIPLDKEDDKVL